MEGKDVEVIRIGHRSARDVRITTHVCLVARALGAGSAVICGEAANDVVESVRKVAEKWGGEFTARTGKTWKKALQGAKNEGRTIVHLTMYGEPVDAKIEEIRRSGKLAVVVGAEQVPGEVYGLADYNVSVTGQPHSEVAALALFLDRYFEGREMGTAFKNARVRVVPMARGKRVEETNIKG
ncbi:MAG: tRNA (cytidine(56)-2'-O)-methyltransferase [Candidatus Burarchaeum sp.]|nr:tRNA (cytidine(56)-2'-O)-methyltransferase [Candidatus Burarchaeum sp.]MDO8339677.1 tRNA (cytidine(56)-2'-O)-methyltransferase [Candidatus Burarchaeum sp.]